MGPVYCLLDQVCSADQLFKGYLNPITVFTESYCHLLSPCTCACVFVRGEEREGVGVAQVDACVFM